MGKITHLPLSTVKKPNGLSNDFLDMMLKAQVTKQK